MGVGHDSKKAGQKRVVRFGDMRVQGGRGGRGARTDAHNTKRRRRRETGDREIGQCHNTRKANSYNTRPQ